MDYGIITRDDQTIIGIATFPNEFYASGQKHDDGLKEAGESMPPHSPRIATLLVITRGSYRVTARNNGQKHELVLEKGDRVLFLNFGSLHESIAWGGPVQFEKYTFSQPPTLEQIGWKEAKAA